jgi:hypothetical protein
VRLIKAIFGFLNGLYWGLGAAMTLPWSVASSAWKHNEWVGIVGGDVVEVIRDDDGK